MINIDLINCNNTIFNSKNAKKKLKSEVSKLFEADPDKFLEVFEKAGKDICQKYVKKDDNISLEASIMDEQVYLKFKNKVIVDIKKNNDIQLSPEEESKRRIELSKYKVKQKRALIKNERFAKSNEKKFKSELKKYSKDSRVSFEMIDAYLAACKIHGTKIVPDPVSVLNEKEKYYQSSIIYATQTLSLNCDVQTKFNMLTNSYAKYMELMTGINFKQFINDKISSLEKEQSDTVTSTDADKMLDEVDILNQEKAKEQQE